MERITLRVEGMSCGGCVDSIQKALGAREGVDSAVADLDAKTVTVAYDAAVIQRDGLAQAIEDAGFEVAA